MKSIFTRLLAAVLSLALVAPIGAQAQGIDPAARGLAVQAKTSAYANFAAVDRRIATLGDSRTYDNSYPVNGLNRYADVGYMTWARFLSGQRVSYDPSRNFGVVGDTTAQILARTDGALAATTAPTWVVFGGTNSIANNVSAAQIISELTQIRDKIKAAGRRVIFVAEWPRGTDLWGAQTFTTPQLMVMNQVRRWILSQTDQQCFVVDVWPTMAQAAAINGRAVNGSLRDGLHANQIMAYATGSKIAAIFNQIFPPVQLTPGSNSEYRTTDNPNGWFVVDQYSQGMMMTGTTGTFPAPASGVASPATGSLADKWALITSTLIGPSGARGTLAVTASKETINGQEWQRFDIVGQAVNNQFGGAPYMQMQISVAANSYVAGQSLEAVCEAQVITSVGLASLSLPIQDQTTFYENTDFANGASVADTVPAVSGVMRTPPLLLDATLAGHVFAFGPRLTFRPNGSLISAGNPYDGTVNASVRVRACGMRAI